MAEDLTAWTVDSQTGSITTPATPDEGVRVIAPGDARMAVIQCDSGMRISTEGGLDGAALDTSNSFFYQANDAIEPYVVWLEGLSPGQSQTSRSPSFTIGTAVGGSTVTVQFRS